MTDWILTIPKTVSWGDYQRELIAAAQGAVLNYRVRHWIGVAEGERVFLVWNGRIRGWMKALGVVHWPSGFKCEVTGARWEPGYYLQRTGAFTYEDGGAMRGFRGVRRFQPDDRHSWEPS